MQIDSFWAVCDGGWEGEGGGQCVAAVHSFIIEYRAGGAEMGSQGGRWRDIEAAAPVMGAQRRPWHLFLTNPSQEIHFVANLEPNETLHVAIL